MIEPIVTTAATALGAGAQRAVEKSAASLIDRISIKFAREKYDELRLILQKGLPDYLAANYSKCETLKTLLNRNDPIELDTCFVAPDFQVRDTKFSSDDFLNYVGPSSRKAIITGLAGCGKSVFLKYSFRSVIEQGHSYYPIFFELRSLNRLEKNEEMLLPAIFESIRDCCPSFTQAQFNYGLKTGAFYFLLDGIDELKLEIREQVTEEARRIARVHNKCAIVATSRPSDEFVSWDGFSEAKLLPFNLDQAVEYISKLQFDGEKKRDFLSDLKAGLFERNRDFLSNPLLAAMMLLTYDSFGEIPEKRHIFYAKCFDVLAREHDASKGRYKRELFSNLAMDQLERIFMFFCALSYVERIFSFNDDQMIRFVNAAIDASGLQANPQDIIRDFKESISIMERVGLFTEFAHRSFQEYFYARFVVSDRRLSLERKIGWLTHSFLSEDTISMIADMDHTYFEDEFLLPNVRSLYQKIEHISPDENPAGILSRFYDTAIASSRPSNEKESRTIVYRRRRNKRDYFQRLALVRFFTLNPEELKEHEAERNLTSFVNVMDSKFGGAIKIHHQNNAKLREIGANIFARRIKYSIVNLYESLEQKQAKRKTGLGALILKEYQK